jgi:hypothetical protein
MYGSVVRGFSFGTTVFIRMDCEHGHNPRDYDNDCPYFTEEITDEERSD